MPRLIIRKSALLTTRHCRRWIRGIPLKSQRRKRNDECYNDNEDENDENNIVSSNAGEARTRLIRAGLLVALNILCWRRRSRFAILVFLIFFFALSFFKLTEIKYNAFGELPYPESGIDDEALSKHRVLPVYANINLVNYRLSRPNCNALEDGDEDEIKLVSDMLYKEIRIGIPNKYFQASTTNCSRFRELRNYAQQPYSLHELQTPLVYVIAVKSSAEQVERLLRAVYAPQNVYCLYNLSQRKDFGKSDLGIAVKLIAGCFSNVFVVSNNNQSLQRDETPYRECLESLLAYPSWRYALLTSEGDFPLTTNRGIVDSVKQAVVSWRSKITKGGESQNLPPLKIANDFSGFVLSRQMVKFAMQRLVKQEASRANAKVHRMSAAPSRDPPSFVDLMIRHDDGCPAGMECVLTSADLYWLLDQPLIFARRFDLSKDYVVIACIEARLQRLNSNNTETT